MSMKLSSKEIVKVDENLKHIAFIMDGNGRWAKKRGLAREIGHQYGAKKFKEVVRHCADIGLRAVTVYAFSTENWKRPQKEVDALMNLFEVYIDDCLKRISDCRFRVKIIGDKKRLNERLQNKIEKIEAETANNDIILNVAINYGGRSEMVNAFNKLLSEGKTEITEEDISNSVYTSDSPAPDLIVRTGGDMRLSNFFLWQAAYSELCFIDTLWPDLTDEVIDEVVKNFYSRKRRYGGL
jgi:undecaprenyl diphosphate synthase